MSWTEHFPILSEELYAEFEEHSTAAERDAYSQYYISQKYSQNPSANIISTSLFVLEQWEVDSDQVQDNRSTISLEQRLLTVLASFNSCRSLFPNSILRIYMCPAFHSYRHLATLEGVLPILMENAPNTAFQGECWAYLALDEDSLVTVVREAGMSVLTGHLEKSKAMDISGFNFWRVVRNEDFDSLGNVVYMPIIGGAFGSKTPISIAPLLIAFHWLQDRDKLRLKSELPGCGSRQIKGHGQRNTPTGEWFLMTAVYPRIVGLPILTFVFNSGTGASIALDIEYVTSANSRSELVFVASPNGACCKQPAPAEQLVSQKMTRRYGTCNGRVLLTGIWQVKYESDIKLINELFAYSQKLDLDVEIKPVLHVQDETKIQFLHPKIVANAIYWKNLNYNINVQKSLMDAVVEGQDADWIWQSDSDERADFQAFGGLAATLALAEDEDLDYVSGRLIDRVGSANILPNIHHSKCLSEQFPRRVKATRFLSCNIDTKIAIRRKECSVDIANYAPLMKGSLGSTWIIPIWHFKWHADCHLKQKEQLNAHQDFHWADTIKKTMSAITISPSGISEIDWTRLPREAFDGIDQYETAYYK